MSKLLKSQGVVLPETKHQ